MITCLIVICIILICGINGQKLSPCPTVLTYEESNYQGRWNGLIQLQTEEELNGIFLTIVLDREAETLGNWFGETVTRNNKEFTIKKNDYTLVPGINVTMKFYVEFNDIESPSVTTIRLNGRTICSTQKKIRPHPNSTPFTSIRITTKPPTPYYQYTTTEAPVYRRPEQSYTEPSIRHEYDSNNRETAVQDKAHTGRRPEQQLATRGEYLSGSSGDTVFSGRRPVQSYTESSTRREYSSNNREAAVQDKAHAERQPEEKPYEEVVIRSENSFGSGGKVSSGRRPVQSYTESNTRREYDSNNREIAAQDKAHPVSYATTESIDALVSAIFDESINESSVIKKEYNTEEKFKIYNRTSTPSSLPLTTRRHSNTDTSTYVGRAPQISIKCGKQSRVSAAPLIRYGRNTTGGEWPWHLAIYKNDRGTSKYICGGTLISESCVVTAAHCVISPDTGEIESPTKFVLYVGTTSINNFSPNVQIGQVSQIRIHPEFSRENYHNDIAILKIAKLFEYTDNVKPVCLWDRADDINDVVGTLGTVVGWGFDEKDRITENLMRTDMPIVNTVQCIYSKPEFFAKFTSLTSYCAGFRNGSSVCNGDSGSGMVISTLDSDRQLTWYLRGLVSVSVPIKDRTLCDPHNYIVFTDVAKYVSWIKKILKDLDG